MLATTHCRPPLIAMHAWRTAAPTSMRRLDRLPQVVRALLPDVIVSAARQLSVPNVACGSFLTWSGALGRCGPAPTTARSAAPLCLLHLRRAAEEKGSCGPSIGRKTQCWYWCVLEVLALLESYPPTAGVHMPRSRWVLPLTELPIRQHLGRSPQSRYSQHALEAVRLHDAIQ